MSKKSSRLSQQTASDIIRRLPLNRQLDASQATLVKLTPSWLDWVAKTVPVDNINHYQLSHVRHGNLAINCENASSASQIKHLKQSLLDFLHEQGFAEIEHITVRIQHPTQHLNSDASIEIRSRAPEQFVTPSDSSLKAIENCQKMVTSEQLGIALAKLADTLRKNK